MFMLLLWDFFFSLLNPKSRYVVLENEMSYLRPPCIKGAALLSSITTHLKFLHTKRICAFCKMLSRILLVCLSLGLFSAGSSLSCRWIRDHKFRQHSQTYLELIANMAHNSTNTTEGAEVEDSVPFPNDLHNQASKASAEDKLGFAVQILNETAALFEEDHGSASWDESTEENFLMAVTEQADKLRSCMGSHGHKKKNKKLHMYFKRLSSHVLKKMHHSAGAWELVRKEIEIHLMRADQLVSSLRRTN